MPKLLRLLLALAIVNMVHYNASSQSLAVNTSGAVANNSAILDVSSTDKGMLVPRMSKTERTAIASPATGLLVFQNAPDSVGFYYYDGTVWQWLASSKTGVGWLTTGNAGTTTANNFFGTTDNVALSFRQNSKWIGRWNSSNSNYFIGDSSGYYTTAPYNVAMGTKALFKNVISYGNVAIGNNSLQNSITGIRNTVVGDSALYTQSYNAGGVYLQDNTAIGSKALFYNQPTSVGEGAKNTVVGSEAMYMNTTGSENTAMGVSAFRENTTGIANTAIGRSAHRLSKSGNFNSYIGSYTGYSDSSGTSNTAVGSYAFFNHRKGNENTVVGVDALYTDTSGSANTAIGMFASYLSDTADLTVSVGYYSSLFNKRDYTTAVGAYAGYSNSRNATNNTQGIENTMVGYAALTANGLGSQNTAMGFKAMAIFEPGGVSSTAPSRNVAIGDSAMHENRGNDNVGVGYRALSKITTNNNQHVAVGSRALLNSTATYPNTAVGYSSQDSATTGYANTSLGSYSLSSNKIGYNNTAIGNAAMYEANNSSGSFYPAENTAVGNDALRFTRYYGHVAIGSGVLRNDTSGTFNTAAGYLSMNQNLSGSGNAAFGAFSMYKNKLSSYNTAVGNNALYSHTIAGFNYNSAFGASALEQDSSGFYNTGVGTSAFRNNQTGFQNTGVGMNAGYWQKRSLNTFIGAFSGVGERFPGTNYAADTGRYNTGVGAYSLHRVASADYNVGVGYQALYSDSSGVGNVSVGTFSMYENKLSGYNTAVGYNSLNNHNVSGWNYNTALGSFAMEQDSSGFQNTGVGTSAFRSNITGFQNTGVGINAGYYQKQSYNTFIGAYSGVGERSPNGSNYAADTSKGNTGLGVYSLYRIANGGYNVAVGYTALTNDSSGVDNVAIGFNSLNTLTTGNQNTAVGSHTNVASNNLVNSSAIGAYAYAAQNNSMVLGSISGVNLAGATVNVGIGVNTPGARLHIRRNGASGGTYIANPSLIIEDNAQSYVQLSNPTNTENGILSGSAVSTIRSGIVFSADSSVYLRSGGNNTRLAVDNSGNIGIGTTTPLSKLHIYESTNVNPNLRIASVSSTYEPGVEFVKTGGGSDWKIRVDAGGILTYSWGADDFVSAPTDYYEMATASFRPSLDNNNALGLSTRRWTAVYAANGTIQTSDARDKENIADLNYGLKEIMKLRPVSFNWKENPQWGKKIGFIAQEVQPILNEVVQVGELKNKSTAKDDNGNDVTTNSDKLGIYYSDIIPVAVKAIQEQQALIEQQAKENAALKQKNAQLEKDIQLIKEKLGIKN